MPFHTDTHQLRTDTALGPVRLAASPAGLCGLWFEGQRHAPRQLDGAHNWPMAQDDEVLQRAAAQLKQWLTGQRQAFDLPVDLASGTPFQQAVWRALMEIGWGETRSYAQIAHASGRPAAVRAAGAAIGRNPLSLVVPCHRVLGASGALTGYAGGLDRKRALLALEAVPVSIPVVLAHNPAQARPA